MDTQVIELLGRNRLTDEILRAGLEVAFPSRDRGIDLIVYADLDTAVDSFISRPIQMKAASTCSFSLDQKYKKFPNLIIAFVWFLNEPAKTTTYGLFYSEALQIADSMGWTTTASWANGQYSTSAPSRKLLSFIEPHKMTPTKWWQKVTGLNGPNKTLKQTAHKTHRGLA